MQADPKSIILISAGLALLFPMVKNKQTPAALCKQSKKKQIKGRTNLYLHNLPRA